MKYKNIVFVLCVTTAAMTLTGCKGKKENVQEMQDIGPGQPLTEVFDMLSNTYQEWEDMQAPITLSIFSPQKLSISGRGTMVRDKAIYFSLKMPFVGEVAQVYANPDSVWFVDKYHKMYLAESLSTLCGQYPMTLDDIQDCILGQAFPLNSYGVTAEYNLTEEVPWLIGLYFERKDVDRKVAFQYAEMIETPAGLACEMANIYAQTDSLSMQGQILWSLTRANWNQGKTVEFNRPGNNYKKVPLESIVN